jgi:hypothetical protein
MDIFKKFLDDICVDQLYTYERVDKLAEVYSPKDVVPIATVEYNRSFGAMVIHFRMGLSSTAVAKLTNTMTLAESHLIFEDDFFIDEQYGYLYGDEARQAFINRLRDNIEAAQLNQDLNTAFFMSEQPLNVFGGDNRSKFQKMWDEE